MRPRTSAQPTRFAPPTRHAQQAAEKAIKAVLITMGEAFPHTHDLVRLCELVPPTWAVLGVEVDWEWLSRYAVEVRYPDDLPDVSEGEAEAAVEDAKQVVQAVERDLLPLLDGV